ncbi:dipeptide epimerase [Reichenbachiella agarivorans]|uniref:Dipeptide epimerase n=1 Tax=Reichenbachiella agarivorans TaxID=2979464 RepID=A0ABY6CMM9_9BACT|nr:dipeptide epimerase [Reichenbachiella agarivorans]UXP31777.1 dipeptide epimerase [Reichenbachiella agarivorans]
MRIVALECWQEKLKLLEPYTIAYETIDSATNVFLRIETDKGINGYGCAAPDWEVTGETGATVLAAFQQIIEPYLKGKEPFSYALILEELKGLLKNQPSALCMVDMALFDLIGKKTQEPVYRLLGGYRDSIPTSVTVGILSVDETLERAKDFIQQGFFILKIKGGSDIEVDIERIMKLREMVGPEMEIRFDANQGYTVAQAVDFMHKIRSANIELLEQPTHKENDNLLKQVSNQVSVPVMADESLMTLKDVFHLTSNNCTDMINIKLMKAGGIMEAMRINAVAKAANVETMVGCMDESSMGIAAGLHFALARPNILYADLDGHFDLIDDPFASMVKCKKGILYPSTRPGFGWER